MVEYTEILIGCQLIRPHGNQRKSQKTCDYKKCVKNINIFLLLYVMNDSLSLCQTLFSSDT